MSIFNFENNFAYKSIKNSPVLGTCKYKPVKASLHWLLVTEVKVHWTRRIPKQQTA